MADYARLSGHCGSYRLVQCHDHRSSSKLLVEQVGHGTAQTAGIILAAIPNLSGSWQVWPSRRSTHLFRDRLLLVSGVAYVDPTVDRRLSKSL